jgi:hypothetical protein
MQNCFIQPSRSSDLSNRGSIMNIIVGYTLSALTAIAGLIVLTGYFLPDSVPMQLRLSFGIVLLLLSVYRALTTWFNARQHRRSGNE